MQTKTLIQAQANVLRVTGLKKGDVVKIVEKAYSSVEIFYGVVIDLLNSGSKTYIQLLRYKKSYGEFTAEIKTYDGEADLALFPVEVNEVYDHFDSVVKSMDNDLKTQRKELQKKEEALEEIRLFVSGEKTKQLTQASFTEITQEQYDEKKRLIADI